MGQMKAMAIKAEAAKATETAATEAAATEAAATEAAAVTEDDEPTLTWVTFTASIYELVDTWCETSTIVE